MLSYVTGGAIIGLGAATAFLWWQNGNLHERIGAARAEVQEAKGINDSNLEEIDILQADLKQCFDGRRVDEEANEETVKVLRAELEEEAARKREVRIIRKEIFRDPTCEDLAALDIGAACPGLAPSVRDRARSIQRGRVQGEGGSDTHST